MEGVTQGLQTGRGRVVLRGKAHIEAKASGREQIIITELPYQVNGDTLCDRVGQLVNDKTIEGISNVNNESNQKEGTRVVIDLKKEAISSVILNQLYKYTELQTSYGINNVALVKGRPRILNVRDLIAEFVDFRMEVIIRRTQFELREAKKKAHILEGYLIALDHLDEVIKLIRQSTTPDIAKEGLMHNFAMSDIQAKAVLELRLQRLTGMERDLSLIHISNRTYNYFTYNNQTDNYQQHQYQLFFNHKWNSHTSFNVATFFTRGLGYYEEYKKAQAFSSYGLPNYIIRTDTIKTTNLIRQLWLDNYFYGNVFSLQYNKDEDMLTIGGGWSKYDGKHYGKIIWADINIPHDYNWYNYTAHKTDYNIYAKYQRAINQYWSLFGDVQYRNVQYTTNGFRKAPNTAINKLFNFFNPKLGIVYTSKDELNAYASFSKASKEPNRDDFENNLIQEPKPEYLYDYELGVEKKFAQASVGATLYYMQYKNQLVLNGSVNDVGEYMRINTPNSYRLGVELQGLSLIHI